MLFDASCGRICGKTSAFRIKASKKNTFSAKLHKKRTHQAFLLGEFVANPVDCDTRDGCTLLGAGTGAMHPELPQEPFIMSIRI